MINKLCMVLLLSLKCVSSVNILFVEPMPSPSHHIWNKALSLALVERGYNVTVITHDKDKEPLPKNYTSILLEGAYEEMYKLFNVSEIIVEENSPFSFVDMMLSFCNLICNHDLKTKGLEQLLNYPRDKFDLIIFDVTSGQCLYPIVEHFNFPPSIAVTAFLLPPYTSFIFGNQLYPSFIPFFSARFTDKMNFLERFFNLLYVYYNTFMWTTSYHKIQHSIAQEHFGSNIKTIEEMDNHFSFLLSNTDPILDYPQPLPPNIIPVGGLHARPPKALPQELQLVIDSSKHGFIIFSLGTNVRSDMLGEEKLNAILNTFRKLPQLVLWKYESDNLKNVPKNVVIQKWLPINDLLGNPKIKLFVTHGGALSTQEAMYHGVPVVGIPFLADQHLNLHRMTTKQLGEIVEFQTLTQETLYNAIVKVLNDSKYVKNMKEVSRRFRDQPQTSLERAVFYVEYTLRHNGAQFLSITSRYMPFYQTANLDIFVTVLVVIVGVIIIMCRVFCAFKNLFRRKKVKTN